MSISCDPSSLMQAAACFDKCEPPGIQKSIKTYLLCQAAASGQFGGPKTPTGFLLSISGDGQIVTAVWDPPVAGVTKTEIWTSLDGVNFSLEVTSNAPNTNNSAIAPPATGSTKYGKIRWCTATTCGNFTAAQSVMADIVSDWVHRVIVNGGASPSQNTITAVRTFYNTLNSNSLWTPTALMINVFAPDSLIAAKTPLLKAFAGKDPWVGTGTIDVNGWITTAASLQTGFIPSTFFSTTDACWVHYFFSMASNANAACGTRITASNQYYMAQPNFGNQWYGWCFTNDGSSLLAQNLPAHPAGCWALTRRANNILEAYRGQATFAPGTMELEFSTAVVGTAIPPNTEYYVGGENKDGVDTPDTTRQISFTGMFHGLTGAQLQTVYAAIDAMRLAFGGGRV